MVCCSPTVLYLWFEWQLTHQWSDPWHGMWSKTWILLYLFEQNTSSHIISNYLKRNKTSVSNLYRPISSRACASFGIFKPRLSQPRSKQHDKKKTEIRILIPSIVKTYKMYLYILYKWLICKKNSLHGRNLANQLRYTQNPTPKGVYINSSTLNCKKGPEFLPFKETMSWLDLAIRSTRGPWPINPWPPNKSLFGFRIHHILAKPVPTNSKQYGGDSFRSSMVIVETTQASARGYPPKNKHSTWKDAISKGKDRVPTINFQVRKY